MVRKKKHTLELDEEFEFNVIGISSHHSDYRLVWAINFDMGLKLEKQNEDFYVFHKKGSVTSAHPLFAFIDEENHLFYYLIKNNSEGKQLIAEKPMIDYFLFVNDNFVLDTEVLITKLKNVNSILGVFPIDPEEIDTEHLIFE